MDLPKEQHTEPKFGLAHVTDAIAYTLVLGLLEHQQ